MELLKNFGCWSLENHFLRSFYELPKLLAFRMTDESTGDRNATNARFGPTRWSIIIPAANQQEPGAQEALEELCRIYRAPLYAFLRKQRGRSREDAEDLVQGFFVHLLSRDRLRKVHP